MKPKYLCKQKYFRIICLFLTLLLALPYQTAQAASQITIADFGAHGLSIYLEYARDENMFRALVAADLVEGRPLDNPDRDILRRIAETMALSPDSGVSDYFNYYTAAKDYKEKLKAQSDRLGGMMKTISGKAFPLPMDAKIWYIDNWYAYRGDNGERFHEGIDITCPMNTPVRSMGSGVVEKLGWNNLGGWRVGIRGDDGLYYYYAHLASFEKGLKVGSKVSAGQVVGYSGDSGNGPEGTAGLYVPHLHIGIYSGTSSLKAHNPYAVIRWAERNRW